MPRDWENVFREWSKPSSDTEQKKSENAERMVRAAIAESDALAKRNIDVFAQGSYRNNTNVRLDSDVDICVVCRDVFFSDFSLAGGLTKKSLGLVDSDYQYVQFKNEVEEALVAKFGRQTITRGHKAFDVHANSYRVDADVVPCFEHRRYYLKPDGDPSFLVGTELHSDEGNTIINWPEQHYQNGVKKNTATGNRFKYITRVLKRLRNEMAETDNSAAKPIPSFLIECLAWNTPNEGFGHSEYGNDMRYVLGHTFQSTMTDETCSEWGEVSELKYLFRSPQLWTREQAHSFLYAAWNYVGFK